MNDLDLFDDLEIEETFETLVFGGGAKGLTSFKGLNAHTLEKFRVQVVEFEEKKTLICNLSDNYYKFKEKTFYKNTNIKLFGAEIVNNSKDLFICDNPFDAMYLSQFLGLNVVSIYNEPNELLDSYELIDSKNLFFIQSTDKFKDIDDLLKLNGSAKVITLNSSVTDSYAIHKNVDLVAEYINGARSPLPIKVSDIGSMIETGLVREKHFGLSTGIRALDKITRGIYVDLLGIGAGTGCGKTTFIKQLAYEMIKQEQKVGCLFFEQDDEFETLFDMAGHFDNINYNHLLASEMDDFEYDYDFAEISPVEKKQEASLPSELKDDLIQNYLTPRCEYLKDKLDIMSSDVGDVTVEDTLRMIRTLVVQRGCKIIVLDHTTYLTDGVENQNQAAQTLMKGLKDIMHRHKVSIFYITHLRKSKSSSDTHEEGARVKLDDFAGGKAVVQYATAVIGLERDMHNEDEEVAEITKMRLLKRRGMGVKPGESVIDMKFSLDCNKLYPADCIAPVNSFKDIPF